MSRRVLIVEDNEKALLSLSKALSLKLDNFECDGTTSKEGALEKLTSFEYSIVLLDLCLDATESTEAGFELLSYIAREKKKIGVIVLTGHGSNENGYKAINMGACNFLEKPANLDELEVLIRQAYKNYELLTRVEELSSKNVETDIEKHILGTSDAVKKLREEVLFAASTDQPIFLSGETGTGKTLCAEVVHRFSRRANNNFIRYQPNFINADLLNSDLFGHKKGAFTGAENDKIGLLKEADTGTFYLDEIDALPIPSQVTLLGVLQDKKIRPLGGTKEITSDFRLITASNADISQLVEKGAIREDFYHRVAAHTIELPPLRERVEDIPLIAEKVLANVAQMKELNVVRISEQARSLLKGTEWKGNIRQLINVIETAAYRADYEGQVRIEAEHIKTKEKPGTKSSATGYWERTKIFQQQLIKDAMKKHDGKITHAAKDLGIDRKYLKKMLDELED